jgi:PTS system galactitol-specific IIB component
MATSTAAAESLREALEEQGISPEIAQCKVSELRSQVDSFEPHVIVTTAKVGDDFGVPVFSGQPFLTGIGEDEVVEEIVGVIR